MGEVIEEPRVRECVLRQIEDVVEGVETVIVVKDKRGMVVEKSEEAKGSFK